MLGVYGIGVSEKRIGEATYTDDPFLVGGLLQTRLLRDPAQSSGLNGFLPLALADELFSTRRL
jgi:hypothetical protein